MNHPPARPRRVLIVTYHLPPSGAVAVYRMLGFAQHLPRHGWEVGFVAPPLVTLVLAVLLMLLFVRGRLIQFNQWLASDYPPLTNVSHGWMMITLFFASAQAFNSVLPERGLLHWLFSFFFLWTLWNNQFSSFDAGLWAPLRSDSSRPARARSLGTPQPPAAIHVRGAFL